MTSIFDPLGSGADADPGALRLDDPRTVDDLRTFVARARVLVPDGYVRLQASGRVLLLTVLVRAGSGLLGSGTALGMRGVDLTGPATWDVTVDLSAVADRLARMAETGSTELVVPPVIRSAAWTAISPPRSAWEVVGEFDTAEISAVAGELLGQVAALRDAGAAEAEIAERDKAVWTRDVGQEPGRFRAALALGAHALGFVRGDSARYLRHGAWQRLSTAAGDVVSR